LGIGASVAVVCLVVAPVFRLEAARSGNATGMVATLLVNAACAGELPGPNLGADTK
jgi:hypothetical protein